MKLRLSVILWCFPLCTVFAQSPGDSVDYAFVYFMRPPLKAGAKNNIELYLNSRPVYAIENGGRLAYKIHSEGLLRITNPAQKNSSEIALNIEKGKSYYVSIGKALSQIQNIPEAEAAYRAAKSYKAAERSQEEDRELPLPRMSIALESQRIKEVATVTDNTVKEKQQKIRNDMDDYFRDLKERRALSNGIEPRANVEVEEAGSKNGVMRYNLRAAYSYEVVEEGIQTELTHYPSGAYLLETSKAALATAMAMKETITLYLGDYFEPGSTVNIRVIGSADAQPISAKISYKGEYAQLNEVPYYLTEDYQVSFAGKAYEIDSVQSPGNGLQNHGMDRRKTKSDNRIASAAKARDQGIPKSFVMSADQAISTNPDLAFLRSYGIRSFMEKEIPILKKTKNKFIHQSKIEKGVGGIYRKVVIEIVVEDILRNK